MRKIVSKRIIAVVLTLGMVFGMNGTTSLVTAQADTTDATYTYDVGEDVEETITIASGGSIASIITAEQNSSTLTTEEWLTQEIQSIVIPRVLTSKSISYSVQVYTDLTGNDPDSGTAALDTLVTGTCSSGGSTTVEINGGRVKVGEKCAIVVTLSSSDGSTIKVLANDTAGETDCYYKDGAAASWAELEDASGVDLDFDQMAVTTIGVLSDISEATVTIDSDAMKKAYTGGDVRLDASDYTVTFGGSNIPLTSDDYTISYSNNVEVGDDATITFTGSNYFDNDTSVSATYKIRYDLSSGLTLTPNSTLTYTGSAITLTSGTYTLTYTNSGYSATLTESGGGAVGDYYLENYTNNINAGTNTASVDVVAEESSSLYMGTGTVNYSIAAKPISETTVAAIADKTWTGRSITGLDDEIILTDGGYTLEQGTDYTIMGYYNNINPSTSGSPATITIAGCNNYNGTTIATFIINDSDGDLKVELADSTATYTYTGLPIKPEIVVYASNWETQYGSGARVDVGNSYSTVYSNNVDAGSTATITVTGSDGSNWEGQTATTNFTILRKNLTDADTDESSIEVTINSTHTYDGSAQNDVDLDVTYSYTYSDGSGGTHTQVNELEEGTDYTISGYSNNVNAGTATVMISGTGNYTGMLTKTFTIHQKSISDATVSVADIAQQPFNPNGSVEVNPVITDSETGATLVQGTDYTLSFENNDQIGTATITITGIGNYTGSRTKTFNIGSRSINTGENSDITVSFASGNYHGYSAYSAVAANLPAPSVVVKDGSVTLTEGVDYSVSYPNNTTVGTKHVLITGMGNYINQDESLEYEILYNLDEVKNAATYAMYDLTYTGEDLIDEVDGEIVIEEQDESGNTVTTRLTKDVDYTLEVYPSNTSNTQLSSITEAGTYYVKVIPTSTSKYFLNLYTTKRHPLTVSQISLNDYTPTAYVTNTYTGMEIPFEDLDYSLIFRDSSQNEIDLVEGEDYTVAGVYADAQGTIAATVKNAVDSDGNSVTYYLKVVGTNNVLGIVYVPFTINKKNIGSASITVMSINTVLYEDTKTTFYPDTDPVVKDTLSDGSVVILEEGSNTEVKDYTTAYANINKVGIAKITFTGTGNYTGTRIAYYRISYDIKLGAIYIKGDPIEDPGDGSHYWSVDTEDTDLTYTYTGSPVMLGTIDLDDQTGDLEVRYDYDSSNTGSANDNTSQLNGQEITTGEEEIDENSDYLVDYTANTDLASPGVKEVTIRGVNNFTGSKKIYYRVVGKLTNATVTYTSQVAYKSTGAYPTDVEVKVGDESLIEGIDYEITYHNNLTVGYNTAYMTITGIGNFDGTLTKKYSIGYDLGSTSAPMTMFSEIASRAYSGTAVTVDDVVVTYGDEDNYETLVEDVNYTVSYEDNTQAGIAKYVITAIMSADSFYVGTAYTTFIISRSITGAQIADIAPQAYTGSEVTLDADDLSVTFEGDTLVLGEDFTLTYENNIEVGEATVTLVGTGGYLEEISTTFPIRYDLGDGNLTGTIADAEYTGEEIVPQIQTLSYTNGEVISADLLNDSSYADDYAISYGENTEIGLGQILVTAADTSDVFMGTGALSFTITPKNINSSLVSITAPVQTWDHGAYLEPVPVVKDDTTVLVEGTDYYVVYDETAEDYSYANNIEPGTATITIYGMGNYTGSKMGTFTIQDSSGDLAAEFVDEFEDGTTPSYEYAGDPIEPQLNIYANSFAKSGIEVEEGTDYEITYSDNLNVGTATIHITGLGEYEGQIIDLTFEITQLDISKATISGVDDQIYTEQAVTPDHIVISVGSTVLVEDEDYTLHYGGNNVDVDKDAAWVKIQALDDRNVTGQTTEYYSIGYDISEISVTIAAGQETYTYDRTAHEPQVVVVGGAIAGGVTLEEGVDYEVTYENNVDAGGYSGDTDTDTLPTIVVTGTGTGKCYVGSKEVTFTINPAQLKDVTTQRIANQEYTGSPLEPGLMMSYAGEALVEGIDYTLTYAEDHTNVGTVLVTATGTGNFTGTYKTNYTIEPRSLTNEEISAQLKDAQKAQVEYKGSAYKPSVVVTDALNLINGEPDTLEKGIDYTVKYSNNVNAGQATITITGMGSYTDSITLNFDIYGSLIDDATYTYEEEYAYTGSAIEPNLVVECAGNILVKDQDYTVTYTNNVNVGTATMTIEAVNGSHYWYNVTKTFEIKNSISGIYVDPNSYAPSYVYTGSAITPDVEVYTDSGMTTQLVKNTDYTVTYEDNVSVSASSDKRGKIIIKGTGSYTGVKTIRFYITQRSVNTLTFSDVSDAIYNGKAKTPTVTVSNGTNKLKNGTDYVVSYQNNTKCGTAIVTVKGSGNYTGSNILRFQITPDTVKNVKVKSTTSSTMTLSWSKVTGASGYEVWTSDNKTKLGTVSAKTTLKLTNLKAKKYYKVTVRAYVLQNGVKSYGASSTEVAATTLPKTPTLSVATSTSKGKVTLKWSKVSCKGYVIYVASKKKGTYKKLKTISKSGVLSYTDTKGTSGKKRYYKIRAYAKVNGKTVYSSYSSVRTVKVK
ncbi:fibronectin type III domain-containing protein [Eubacterium oxidoreducens]|uniref:Fibronectin type-III domain-containing protein n=1 Tax=Eubacterium oxidoreducens TaxID=1732 RepID=A0A1G6CIE3_EUBOX|nr:hypothetical protein [Eubacterium oxidoreducens]SDB32669.1 hypothetical protein SAMN02910417_02420 [Eubacterium oxidoreducens]